MGFKAPQQFYRYLQPDAPVPTKRILKSISTALELSWPIAALMAGYVDEFFSIVQALCTLGLRWYQEDGLAYNPRVGAQIPQELEIPKERYVVINRYDAEINRVSPRFDYWIAIPNPMAAAIILVRARFPMKWETPRAEANGYWQAVLREQESMIAVAEDILNRMPGKKAMHPLLRRALSVLNDRLVLRNRHWVAAEYVDLWAEEICTPFARYVTNALYQQPTLGSLLPNPDVRRLPQPDELKRR